MDPTDLGLGHVDADVELCGLEQLRGRCVGREDVTWPKIERFDARRARGANDELVEHHIDLLQASLGGLDEAAARAHVLGRSVQERVQLRT